MAAATASATAVLGGARLTTATSSPPPPPPPRSSSLLLLPPIPPRRSFFSNSSSLHLASSHLPATHRFSSARIRATSSEETTSSFQTDELLADLKEKWDGLENKSTVFIYGGGALVAVWLSSIVIGAINSVPLLPKILELVGLGYTGWFVYRYLLFKSSRKELAGDIELLKKKIAGTGE